MNDQRCTGYSAQQKCIVHAGIDYDRLDTWPKHELRQCAMRFFVGEAMWPSQQLEAELAQGSWMLLAPDQALLRRVCMDPQSFDPR